MGEGLEPKTEQPPLFVYGTLRDEELLATLIGRAPAALELMPARAAGWRVAAIGGGPYPGLARSAESRLEGLLVLGLDARALARITAYEAEDYRIQPIEVLAGDQAEPRAAQVFAPMKQDHGLDDEPDWSFEGWRAAFGAAYCDAARALAPLFARIEAAGEPEAALGEVVALWPDLVGAALLRQGEKGPVARAGGFAHQRADSEVLERARPYAAYFKIDEFSFRHRLLSESDAPREGWSAPVRRSVFITGPAVSVVPYDPRLDRVMLIEQFRAGLYAAGDAQPWSIEVIAGRIDAEDRAAPDAAERTARREALEEAGLPLGRLERIMLTYASPGCVDEALVHYVGEADLSGRAAASLHGLPEEGEDIRAFVLPLEEAMMALAAEEIRNAPAVLTLLWLDRHRPRLQRLWRA